jgi:protein SCO1/2
MARALFLQSITRRRIVSLIAAGFGLAALNGCDSKAQWHTTDVSGISPPFELTMTRASDGKQVTQADYRGQIVLLYFGYTFCPDVCPTTLSNVAETLRQLGPEAQHIRVLFVTVDPRRDTPSVLAQYVNNFAPQVEGLRGTPDQLAALARRYRVVYSVTPAAADDHSDQEVTHSSAIYVFDGSGAARLLISSLSSTTPDISGTAADLKRLIKETDPPGFFTQLLHSL